MSKIVRNVTGSPITISDVGVTIPAGNSYTIPPQDYLLWAASSNTVTYVGASQLVVNDGSVDLTVSRGIDLIKGIYPNPYTISTPVIVNLSMPSAGTEYSYTFPVGLRQFALKARGTSKLQVAYTLNQSGTTFDTVWPGGFVKECNISQSSALSVFVQANKSSEILEITYWT